MAEKAKDPAETTGVSLQNVQPDVKTDDKTASLGPSTPRELRRLAEDLPDKDPVQKAMKDAMTAEDQQKEAQAKAKAAEESPNALDTPSGGALKKVAGVSNDTERGERYARERAARRWGYADES